MPTCSSQEWPLAGTSERAPTMVIGDAQPFLKMEQAKGMNTR